MHRLTFRSKAQLQSGSKDDILKTTMLREALTLIRPAGRMGVHNSKHAAFRPSRQLAYRSSATCTAQKDIILR